MKRANKELLAFLGVPMLYCALGYLLIMGMVLPMRQVCANAIEGVVSDLEVPTVLGSSISYDPEALKAEALKAKSRQQSEAQRPSGSQPNGAQNATNSFVSISSVPQSVPGNQVGNLYCARIGLEAPVMWGDTEYEYAYGAGQDTASSLPGYGKLVLISGHNTTFFSPLEFVEVGDVIHYDTAYGKYEYTVRRVEVYMEHELQELINQKDIDNHEQLIMYTCYPFHPVESRRTDRLTVFGERTVGPDVR